eukprot:401199_1
MSTLFTSCSTTDLTLKCIFAFVCVLLVTFIVYILVKVCKHHEDEMAKSIQKLQYVFIVSTICSIAMSGTSKLLYCTDLLFAASICGLLYLFFFAVQSYLLLFIFYMKLRMVFKGTVLQIAKCTNICYTIMFAGMPFSFIMAIVLFFVDSIAFFWFEILFLFFAALTMLSLVVIFVHKFIHVYRQSSDEELITLITRTTLLAMISISITIVDAMNTVLIGTVDSIVYHWICHYIALFDLFSNLICIVIGYQMFKKYYFILCSPMDRCCRLCCSSMVGKKQEKRSLAKVVSITSDPASTQSSIQSTQISV